MTRNLSVVPVADYEPPPLSTKPYSPPPMLRRPARRPLHAVPRPVTQEEAGAATAFADVALRGVLEVLDGRRPLAQLRPLLGDRLTKVMFAMVTPNGSSAPSPLRPNGSSAVLRRVRLRLVDPDGDAAEVFATYSRAERIRAIAARIERSYVRGRRRWQLVAVQVG